jgi:hypothetical protein
MSMADRTAHPDNTAYAGRESTPTHHAITDSATLIHSCAGKKAAKRPGQNSTVADRLPKPQQRVVMQVLESVLAQQGR